MQGHVEPAYSQSCICALCVFKLKRLENLKVTPRVRLLCTHVICLKVPGQKLS